MKLADLLKEGQIQVDLSARDKWEALTRLLDLLIAQGRLKEEARPAAYQALVAREKVSSTGMEFGVALPHASLEGLEQPLAALGLSPQGVPFQSPDGQASRIIVLLLIPHRDRLKHTPTLASIARLLQYEETREALTRARSAREAMQVVKDEDART
ncbi:MAG TPA: PTS sugar transporter subunit IIA [Planctomycetota bacterium]|nr:PTS sugar transporter subunit IIA [Planctomycetota bacterium]